LRLYFVRTENVPFTGTVSMLYAAFEHIRDDFHVAMGVQAETFSWGDAIIIQHPQDAKIRIRGIIIVPKGKRIKSPEPAAIRMYAILTLTKRDHYLSVAELYAHDLCALDERLQLHLGNHAGQRFHAAICGQVHAVGRDHFDNLTDSGRDLFGGFDHHRAN